ETVDVSEDFNEAYIVVDLKGASEIDKDTVKVKVNDKTYDYAKNQEIGPYPKTKELTVSAEGQAKKKTFKSAETVIKTDNLKDKKEKEENSFRNKVINFFGNYTAAMNSAHSQSNFNLVSSYLKTNTDNYKSTKNEVQGNTMFYLPQPQITEIVRQGDTFYVKAQTVKEDGQYGEVDYQLEGDDDASNLKVVKYSE